MFLQQNSEPLGSEFLNKIYTSRSYNSFVLSVREWWQMIDTVQINVANCGKHVLNDMKLFLVNLWQVFHD